MSGPEAAVRLATPGDARALAECHVACWHEAYRGLVPDEFLASFDVVERERRWAERLVTPELTTAVAVLGDDVVGFACVAPGELRSLYVRAAHHGTGLADRLLALALGDAPARLWVYTANARARRFYERHGFRADGTAKVDPPTGVPEIRMVRP